MTRRRSSGVFFVIVLLILTASCAKRRNALAEAAAPVHVTLRAQNNLRIALSLSARDGSRAIWSGIALPGSGVEASLGLLDRGLLLTLRATDPGGAIVSLRDSVSIVSGLLIWTIP
jgi:hypothetical protein